MKNSLKLIGSFGRAEKLHVDWIGVKCTHMERISLYAENAETVAAGDVAVAPGEIVTLSNFSAE